MKNTRGLRKNIKSGLSIAFGVLGAISIFWPLSDVTLDNMLIRSLILVAIVIGIVAICWIVTYQQTKRKSHKVYKSGKTSIYFDYDDIGEILKKSSNSEKAFTVVVPVNTMLKHVFNRNIVKPNTIHRACLDYIYEKQQKELSIETLAGIEKKKGKFIFSNGEPKGKIGDWFILGPEDLSIDSKVSFLFLETYNIVEINGTLNNEPLSKESYLSVVQCLMNAIPEQLNIEDCIYIPLIGAGAGNIGKPIDIMHIMNAILRFNKGQLRQEIHVIISDKNREECPIYQLENF